ncbi:MAG: glycoside hydrolase family 15 protein, partial [Myxococcales bacterium]|nr:glycoside hydrolase family 15 protein [Myxococcales bacterium]
MSAECSIADHALIGNGQSAALISRDGAVTWCCWPRFDSPALFCRLLDAEQGGFFRVAPTRDAQVSRAYEPGTNVLRTTFETTGGRLTLTDLMPAPGDRPDARDFPHQILRRVACEAGEVEVAVTVRPTFDFARVQCRFEMCPGGAVAYGQGEALGISTGLPLRVEGDALVARTRLKAGDERWIALTHGPAAHAERSVERDAAHLEDELQATRRYWREWSDQCAYHGPYRDAVLRSALALKLLIFQPTGGIIAAPTTSLPADPGGVRNWDYRYTWLRDAGLVLDALQQIGFHDETKAFIDWLEALCGGTDCDLGVLY